jgi:hypothetical protein
MMLIKHVVHDPDLPGDVDHKVKKPYVKRKGLELLPPLLLPLTRTLS